MNTFLNDSLIDASNIEELKKECYDSLIINKYKLGDESEFIASFDSLQEVKDLTVKRNSTIIKNADKILQTYNFNTGTFVEGRVWGSRVFKFDGKMITHIAFQMKNMSIGWTEEMRWTGTYKIEVEPNGKTYVTISFPELENDIYQLMKSSKDGYYLKGRRTLWQEEK